MAFNLFYVGLAGRNNAKYGSPHRIDDNIYPSLDHSEYHMAVLAIVPATILDDDPVPVRKDTGCVVEIKTSVLKTGFTFILVPFEFHKRHYRPLAYNYQFSEVPFLLAEKPAS